MTCVLTGHLDELIADTVRLRRRFVATAPRVWDATSAGAELAVQLGHLAICVLRRSGADLRGLADDARPIDDIGDELADVTLAALSVCVLTDTRPEVPDRTADPPAHAEVPLLLVVAGGRLAETAMVTSGHRHLPAGAPPSVAAAAGAVLAACDDLAASHGLDLVAEFRAMVADADAFLDTRGVAR